MELYLLRTFIMAARLGHLTRAAEMLHLSQPTVSGQIRALEDELGVPLFVLYFAPTANRQLAHSVGLQKGLLGVVNVFASPQMESENNIVITHELLHTFGATDKYDAATNRPRFPEGYAEPDAEPRYPQGKAEIMAGRIPVSATQLSSPRDFEQVVIGAKTAQELSWQR